MSRFQDSEQHADYSHLERSHFVQVRISERDMRSAFNPLEIISDVRSILASRIADHVMREIGPALDEAISKYRNKPETNEELRTHE